MAMAAALSMLVALLPLYASANSVEVGYRGPSFQAAGVSAPTADKPQSKLWFNDGSWWGALYSPYSSAFTIHKLDWATQTWFNTEVILDERENGQPDVLWDGTWLYVVSSTVTGDIVFRRLTYNPLTKEYAHNLGPTTLVTGGSETVVLDKDTTGTVWVTYTRNNSVYVTHGGANDDSQWVTPYVIPVTGAANLTADDISAVVAFNTKIGVMWSNQNDDAMYFATHVDGESDTQWTVTPALQMPEYADDHINLKALQADERGQVYAAVKTSLNVPDDPLILLLRLTQQGGWQRSTFSTVADNHTRAIVLLDQQGGRVHMFAAAPCCGGGIVYTKSSNLGSANPNANNVSFPAGLGTPAIQSSLDTNLNNVSSTKQVVSAATGMVVIAADDHTRRYVHNAYDLGSADTIPPDTRMISGPPNLDGSPSPSFVFGSNEAAVTYECSLDGAAFQQCAAQSTFAVSAGPHTLTVRSLDAGGNHDPTPVVWNWNYDPAVLSVNVDADATVAQQSATTPLGLLDDIRVDGATTPEQALLRFQVPSLPGTPDQILLRAYVQNGFNSANNPLNVYATNELWSEVTVTWSTRPALVGDPVTSITSATEGAWVEFDLTNAISSPGPYDFALTTASSDGAHFASKQALGNRPHLVFRYPAAVNNPPVMDPLPVPVAPEGSPVTFQATATDPDPGDSLTYSMELGPSGATLDPVTGQFSWTAGTPGDYPVTIRVTDDGDPMLWDEESTTITVTPNTGIQVFRPTHDSYVSSKSPSSNYGQASELKSDGSPVMISYMRFDLWPLNGASVSDAKLRMYVQNPSRGTQQLWFLPRTELWSEDTLTYVNRPSPSGLIGTFVPSSSGSWVEVDITDTVAAATGLDLNLAIQSSSSDGYAFSSDEALTNGVQLVVTVGGAPPPPDTTPPETMITSAPPEMSQQTSATFEFVADEPGSTFECEIDGSGFAACVSPTTYTALADGPHSFEVRATDAAGNIDPTPAQHAWTIDASIQTVTLFPTADTRFQANSADTSFGSSTVLAADQSPAETSALKFDLGSITGTIVSAKLVITVDNGTKDGPKVYLTNNHWNEASTWNTRPLPTGSALGDTAAVGKGTLEIPLSTSFFTGPGNYSFVFEPDSRDGMDFPSREASTGRPVLVLEVASP